MENIRPADLVCSTRSAAFRFYIIIKPNTNLALLCGKGSKPDEPASDHSSPVSCFVPRHRQGQVGNYSWTIARQLRSALQWPAVQGSPRLRIHFSIFLARFPLLLSRPSTTPTKPSATRIKSGEGLWTCVFSPTQWHALHWQLRAKQQQKHVDRTTLHLLWQTDSIFIGLAWLTTAPIRRPTRRPRRSERTVPTTTPSHDPRDRTPHRPPCLLPRLPQIAGTCPATGALYFSDYVILILPILLLMAMRKNPKDAEEAKQLRVSSGRPTGSHDFYGLPLQGRYCVPPLQLNKRGTCSPRSARAASPSCDNFRQRRRNEGGIVTRAIFN